jgi:diguanylate cyclase (GGDEF)-like protein
MKQDEKNSGWKEIQDRLADESGLAVVLVEGEDSSEICVSNNNSICRILYNSAEFAPRCAEYCGKAVQIAHEAGKAVHVKCHADLNFLTVPVETKDKKSAAIVGRAFLKSEDYRKATERAATGDWHQFPPEELFENVLIAASIDELEKTAEHFEKLTEAEREQLEAELSDAAKSNQPSAVSNQPENSEAEARASARADIAEPENQPQINTDKNGLENEGQRTKDEGQTEDERVIKDPEEAAAWRSFFGALLDLEYKTACLSLLDFLSRRYGIRHLAWLERRQAHLEAILATGKFEGQSIQIKMSAEDERLLEVLQKETALELRERKTGANGEAQTIWLFPVAVGGEIRGGLVVGERVFSEEIKRKITQFIRRIAPQIEILRLREELKRQSLLSGAMQRFNESLQTAEAEDFWTQLAQSCAELMRAERGSLLFFDEETQNFIVKAATGNRADIIREETETLGVKVAQKVFQSGEPLVVPDINETPIPPAPPEWNYKTDSFISYPITIGGQKIGVLNVTDKTGGEIYDRFDLELLNSIAPQLAVALDRVTLKQLSMTDKLTGLYNLRYLEARLAEEISLAQRHGFPLSFMMIDVDKFKSYNDDFGHGEGNKALQIVAQCLKESLRGADVAARYGGEEFSILLPQTTLGEARIIAERVRQKVEETEFPNRKVTISIGVSSCSPDCTQPELMSEADKALYQAKASGRNKVRIYEDLKERIHHRNTETQRF